MQIHFANDLEMESLMLDGTTMQAHPGAAQALKNRAQQRALGRSSRTAGFSTQIHGMLEKLENLLAFIVTAGQVHDKMLAPAPIAQRKAEHAMADKAYEADAFIPMIQALVKGTITGLAPRANRTQPREYEIHFYRQRNWVECLIHKIKPYPRIFSRFEKTATNDPRFLPLVTTRIEL